MLSSSSSESISSEMGSSKTSSGIGFFSASADSFAFSFSTFFSGSIKSVLVMVMGPVKRMLGASWVMSIGGNSPVLSASAFFFAFFFRFFLLREVVVLLPLSDRASGRLSVRSALFFLRRFLSPVCEASRLLSRGVSFV